MKREKLGTQTRLIKIDMEEVYRLLDSGLTVKEVATRFGVSRNTLYRKHHEYQDKIQESGLPKLPDR